MVQKVLFRLYYRKLKSFLLVFSCSFPYSYIVLNVEVDSCFQSKYFDLFLKGVP